MPAKKRGAPAGQRTRASRTQIPGEQYLYLRTGSATWQISFGIKGYRFRESSGTEDKVAAAALALRRYDEEWRRIQLGEEVKRDVTLNAAFVRYYKERAQGTAYGERAQKHQMAQMLRLLGRDTRLADLTDAKVNAMVQALKSRVDDLGQPDPLSPATINRYLTTLNCVCKRAREMWAAEVGPWRIKEHKEREPEGREVFLDQDQARRLVEAACGHLKPILLMEFCSGLRRTNLLELAWESVSLDMGRVVLIQKGDRRHSVTLVPAAIALLQRMEPDPAKRRGPVFWFGNPNVPCECERCRNRLFRGQPVKSVKRAFATAAREAGVRDMPNGRLRFHDLRHTFASWLLASGGDLILVKEALGHSQISTTARYSHLLPGRKEQVIDAAVSGLMDAPAPRAIEHTTPRKKASGE